MSEQPFFSIIITTCRPDFSMKHRKETHVLGLMIENLINQTFRDFELIIVDLVWRHRKMWVADNYGDVGFPILHITDKNSIYRDLNLIRICSARNTGLVYARGKCAVFSDDGQYWSSNALEALVNWGRKGHGATCRLHRDRGVGAIEMDSRWQAHGIAGTQRTKVLGAQHIGYLGGTLSMVPMEKMLECNGWDEMFDGTRQLEDSDMAKRLGNTGLRIALEGHPYVVEHDQKECDARIFRRNIMVKCNGSYCYPLWENEPDRIRANDRVMTDDMIKTFIHCQKLNSDGRCLVSKDECKKGGWNRRSLMDIYKDERLVFDLRKLREERSWDSASCDPLLIIS